MILGLGTDLCDIRRIEKTLARFGDRFTCRVFTEIERAKSDARPARARAGAYAKRFAAKEACAKALGTGLAQGVGWREIGVVNLASGKPTLALEGRARERLAAITPAGLAAQLHIALTDDFPLAQAVVIIYASQFEGIPSDR